MALWSWTAESLSPDDIHVPPMKDLLRYWRSRLGTGAVPDQRALHVAEMPKCTANIALVLLRKGPLRAKYRLVGRNLVKLLGEDPTGKYVHDVYKPSVADEIYKAIGEVLDAKKPIYFKREFQILGKSFGYHRLLLPLCLGKDEIDRVLICIYPTNKDLTDAEQWQSVVREYDEQQRAEQVFADQWFSSLDDEHYELTEEVDRSR